MLSQVSGENNRLRKTVETSVCFPLCLTLFTVGRNIQIGYGRNEYPGAPPRIALPSPRSLCSFADWIFARGRSADGALQLAICPTL